MVAGASEVRVTLGRHQTTLLASGCRVPPRSPEIHQFLGRPLDRSRSPARPLAVGLLSAWKAFPDHLALEWREDRLVHRLDFRGAAVTSSAHPEGLVEGQFRIEWQRRLSGGFWERFRRLLRGQLSEHKALTACRYAVSPVLVDARALSREVSSPARVSALGHLGELRPDFPLLVAYHPAPVHEPGALLTDLPRTAFRGRRLARKASHEVGAGILTTASTGPLKKVYPSPTERGQAMWLRFELRAGLSGLGRICFVHDGVVIEERRLALGVPGAVAWASAHGLTTDLSEFRLVEDAAFQRLCQAIHQSLLETLNRCAEELRELLTAHPRLVRRLQSFVPGLRALPKPVKTRVRPPRQDPDQELPPPPRTLKPNDYRPR